MFEVQFFYNDRWSFWARRDTATLAKLEAIYWLKRSYSGSGTNPMTLRVINQQGHIIASYEDPEEYDSNGLRRTNG